MTGPGNVRWAALFWEEMSNYHKGFTVTCPPDGYHITIIFQPFLLTESTKYLLFIVYFDKVKKIFIFYILIIFVYYTYFSIRSDIIRKMRTRKVIKILRKNKNMTQDQLSEALEVNKSSIQKYVSRAVHNLKMDTILNLCTLFDVPPWVFVFPGLLKGEGDLTSFQSISESVDFALALNARGVVKVLQYALDLIDSGNYRR